MFPFIKGTYLGVSLFLTHSHSDRIRATQVVGCREASHQFLTFKKRSRMMPPNK